MNTWGLPTALEVGGCSYAIHADFRDILEIIGVLTDMDTPEQERIYVALALFYKDFPSMPGEVMQEAANQLVAFIGYGEDQEDNDRPSPKLIDWEQDRNIIIADINKVAGQEVRALSFCHWWTFLSYFNGIGEGQLSTVVSIREKLRKGKKLADWERDYYRKNRSKIDFKQKFTEKENEELNKWLGK